MTYAYIAIKTARKTIDGYIMRFNTERDAYNWAFYHPFADASIIPDELLGEYHVNDLVFLPTTYDVDMAYFETVGGNR